MSESNEKFADVREDGGVAGYEPKFIDVDGIRTRYYDVGSGEPLVLVHGGTWSGLSSANTWALSFEYLSKEFRVIAFDRIACGMTDNPDNIEDYHWDTELEHSLAFLDALDLDSIHIGGSSRGGGLATRMAVEEPDRFKSLVIINSATLGPWSGDRSYRGDRIFERYTPDFDPTDPEYTRFRYTQYSYQTNGITDEFCRTNGWMRSRPKARETARIMSDPDGKRTRHAKGVPEALETAEEEGRDRIYQESKKEQMKEAHRRIEDGMLTIPTLYFFGRNDLTVRLETGIAAFDMIAQHNPNVRLKLVNHCSHLPYREIPEEFSQTIIDFVNLMHD